jgi:HEAT repeat protein
MRNWHPSPSAIAACVLEAYRNGAADEAITAKLVAIGVRPQDATSAIELVRSGIARAALIQAGLGAGQISSDFDDNPIFRAAVELAHLKLSNSKQPPSRGASQLLSELDGADIEVRRSAAYELGRFNEPTVIERLIQALEDSDLYIRVYAIQSLARLKCEGAVDELSDMMKGPRIIVSNVIRALVEIGDARAVPALVTATQSEDAFIRHDAAWALGSLFDKRAVPALQALLSDETIPIEKDALGLTMQTSIYSVSEQAKRSLSKIDNSLPRG